MKSEREDETATLWRTVARDADRANAFSMLSRYETAIERQLCKARPELKRRQAARNDRSVTPPQVVNVDVSGIPKVTAEVWLCFVILGVLCERISAKRG